MSTIPVEPWMQELWDWEDKYHLTNPLPRHPEVLKNLEILNVSLKKNLSSLGSKTIELPKSIYNLKNLKELHIKRFPISHLSEKIERLDQLEVITVELGTLSKLPENIGNLDKLKFVSLNVANLLLLPASMSQLESLSLHLTNNSTGILSTGLKRCISSLSNLVSLKITLNTRSLHHKPDIDKAINNDLLDMDLTNLSNLIKLTIESNTLVLSENIGDMSSLEHLTLICHNLTYLPQSIKRLRNLKELTLELSDDFDNLPKTITALTKLERLFILSGKNIELPESIDNLTALKHLYIVGLSYIPKSIGGLPSLTNLDIQYSPLLQSIPDSLFTSINLAYLSLDGCSLTALPHSLGNLSNLIQLNISKTPLASIPDSIGNLKHLEELSIYKSQITTLPVSIGNLKSLVTLDLERNCINELPNTISNLKNVQILNLSYNRLEQLPDSLTKLESLRKIYLKGNSLTCISSASKELLMRIDTHDSQSWKELPVC